MNISLLLVLTALLVSAAVICVIIWLSVRRQCPARDEAADSRSPIQAEETPTATKLSGAKKGGAHPRPAYLEREARRELLLLDERLHRVLLDDPGMSPDEWAKIADAVVFVHDRMCPELAVERFERATDTTVTPPGQTELTPREVFAHLNEQLDLDKRLRLLRELHDQIDADVYVPAETDQSAGTSSR